MRFVKQSQGFSAAFPKLASIFALFLLLYFASTVMTHQKSYGQAANLVTNPGFESGTTNWTDFGGNPPVVQTNNSHSDTFALQLGTGASGRGQTIPGSHAGKTYMLSGWGKASNTTDIGYIGASYYNGAVKISQQTVTFTGSTAYEEKSLALNIPSDTTRMDVWTWVDGTTGNFYFDDISLTDGTASTPIPTVTDAMPTETPSPTQIPCPQLPTDTGSITLSFSVAETGTYRIWSLMNVPDTTNNSYWLQIDDTCGIIVGDGGTIPNNTWSWVGYQEGNPSTPLMKELSAGDHIARLIGREENIKIDKLLITSDISCNPTGFGENCSNSPTATTVPVTPTTSGSSITIHAAGTKAFNIYPIMELRINDVVVQTFSNIQGNPSTGTYQQFTYNHGSVITPTQVKVAFINDASDAATSEDRNLTVDKIVLNGIAYQTEAPDTYSIGSYSTSNGCGPGYKLSQNLNCNGYFNYKSTIQVPTNTPAPTATRTPTPAVDTIKPTVSITSPANGSRVTRNVNITVSATASDNRGVTRVVFQRAGVTICTDTVAPYSCSMFTDSKQNRNVTYTATAYDAANNFATSTVTVKTN